MKSWRRLSISLLAAAGLHAGALLALRLPGRVDEPRTTIEVSVIPTAAQAAEGQPAARKPLVAEQRAAPDAVAARALAAPATEPAATAAQAAAVPDAVPPPEIAAPEAAPPQAAVESVSTGGALGGTTGAAAAETSAAGGDAAGGSAVGGVVAERAAADAGATSASGAAVGSVDGSPTAPSPRAAIAPVYPLSARRAGYEGVVTVGVLIDETGRVESAEVISSSGHAALDKAALDAVRKALFEPAHREGKPVAARATLAVRFVLK